MTSRKYTKSQLKDLLDSRVARYNTPAFIPLDPVSIPHMYSRKQDIEIAGFFAAVLAWGQRKTIVAKCKELMRYMDEAPYDFIRHHTEADLKPFADFKHRTFNGTDTLYFIEFLKTYYQKHESLEDAFAALPHEESVEGALVRFHQLFFSLPDFPSRTQKHIATPMRKSTCKRLNMYLRWMVRKDDTGVDFGLWNSIKMSQLVCPCDLHVDRVARSLNLITRKPTDWLTAMELTINLRKLDPADPIKYDFALFGLGVIENWSALGKN